MCRTTDFPSRTTAIHPSVVRARLALCLCAVVPLPVAAQVDLRENGGELVYAETAPVTNTHPYGAIARDGPTDRVMTMIYEPLFRFNYVTDEWENVLAAGSSASPGGVTFTVQLKPGVLWHDGTPFTAEDVVFTYDYIRNVATDVRERQLISDVLSQVFAADAETVVFQFKEPVTDPRDYLDRWIIPASKFDRATYAPLSPGDRLTRRPLGTGPFKFDRWTTMGGQPLLSVNENYHERRAFLENIEVRRLTDLVTLVAQLQCDGPSCLDLSVEVPSELIPQLTGSLTVRQVESYTMLAVAIRQDSASALSDKNVRQALTMAVDREALLETWFQGYGQVLPGPVVPNAPFYDPAVRPLPYDPARARQLLAEAGARTSLGTLRFIYPRAEYGLDTRIQNMVTSIREALEAVGLSVELVPLELGAYREALATSREFDLAWQRWEFDPVYDVGLLFHSSNRVAGGFNIMNYSNPAVDLALERFSSSRDANRQSTHMSTLQRILADDAPAIFLFSVEQSYAYRANYVIPSVDPFFFFTNVAEWSFIR